jgi:pyruvate-ferredoxin/flavodoxin oxidoreductase
LKDDEVQGIPVIPAKSKELSGFQYRIQISPMDCTGCGVCATACPAKCLKLIPVGETLPEQQDIFERLAAIPNRGHLIKKTTVRGSQFQQPLLEFNGACMGCGEPAILKLITQLYGDQLMVACATGCSLVWGATYPFNPWTTNEKGHGPAWANSLFEDNAEFGYGIIHAIQARRNTTKKLICDVVKGNEVYGTLKQKLEAIVDVWEDREKTTKLSEEIKPLLAALGGVVTPNLKRLQAQADILAKKTIWIMGGDGWAYDIGYGGLDHALASGENVNIVVLDTEVYSNTGGQCSKATQRGAVASFSADGYTKQKKDLGAIAITYGNIYVASTCLLADPAQALKAVIEATEYEGPSLIINYSPCINHGIKKGLGTGPNHCKDLVKGGYILLYRYDPRRAAEGKVPLQLDSKQPEFSIAPLLKGENRFSALVDLYPGQAEAKHPQLVADLKRRYEYYLKLSQGK